MMAVQAEHGSWAGNGTGCGRRKKVKEGQTFPVDVSRFVKGVCGGSFDHSLLNFFWSTVGFRTAALKLRSFKNITKCLPFVD